MEKIQEILFENKESIPDGIYLKLMDELKIAYPNRNSNDIIKITYTRIHPVLQKSGYDYTIQLIETPNLTIILKKSDFNPNSEPQITKLEAIPFVPFLCNDDYKKFKDDGYMHDHEQIFKYIKKDEPDESDDEFDPDCDSDENKRKISFKLSIHCQIKYMITNVEKLN
jgi:hypothetical protein